MTTLQGLNLSEVKLGTVSGWLLATSNGARVAIRIDTIISVLVCDREGRATIMTQGHSYTVDQTPDDVVEAIAWKTMDPHEALRNVCGGAQ